MGSLSDWARDTIERAAFTFVEAFLGLLVISGSDMMGSISVSTLEAAGASALISALAVVKAAIASRRETISPASMIAPAHDLD